MSHFMKELEARAQELDTRICVGIDPHPEDVTSLAELEAWALHLAEQTAPYALCFKVNIAFFEAHGAEGMAALERLWPQLSRLAPLLLDAKRGDISSTAAAYAKASFERWGARGLTVSPYLGLDTLEPFLAYPQAGLFVLCHTSNAGAATLQRRRDTSGEALYESVARLINDHPERSRLGLVVGATQPEALESARALAPDAWLLCPGIGAQGGDLSALMSAAWGDQGRVLVAASRSIARADSPAEAARALRDEVRLEARALNAGAEREAPHAQSVPSTSPERAHLVSRLARALLDAQCVLFGDFKLKSGLTSPIYLDLRRLSGSPEAFEVALTAYQELLTSLQRGGLEVDALSGLPLAGLPLATGLALSARLPLCYPRPPKAHGTQSRVEGGVDRGAKLLLVDDLATRGASALEVIPTLRASYTVQDLIVLIDRESGARARLAEVGVQLHAVVTLNELLDEWARAQLVSLEHLEETRRWLSAQSSS